jgi:signal transduction histidine kinase
VDDLLDIARIERDHVELRKEPVDLVSVVNRVIEESRHHIDDRRHSLSLFLPSEPVRVMADPMRLEQIASNLLSNAAKYTDAGGEIAVIVERMDDDAIITVRDNGIGIAPESLPQLFEMFFQADASRPGGRRTRDRAKRDKAPGGAARRPHRRPQRRARQGQQIYGSLPGNARGAESK